MSLEDCMAYAVEHSTTVGQQVNSLESSRQDYISAVASALPSIGASTGGNVSFGRSIDPETNTYTTTSTFSNSYGISASMTVFNGLSTINSIRATKVLRAKGAEDLQLARDEVAMNTMSAYFDVDVESDGGISIKGAGLKKEWILVLVALDQQDRPFLLYGTNAKVSDRDDVSLKSSEIMNFSMTFKMLKGANGEQFHAWGLVTEDAK